MLFPFRNMRDVLGLHAKVSSRKIAVISYNETQNCQELSYLEFVGKAHQVANFLYEDLGINRGDTLALASPNNENALLLCFATWVIGASVVLIDLAADDDTLHSMLLDSEAHILFVDADFLLKIAHISNKIVTIEGIVQMGGERSNDYLRFEDLAANRPTTFLGDESGAKGADVPMTGGNERTARLSDVALITYHNQQRITRTQGDLLYSAHQYATATALTGNQIALAPLPLHFHFAEAILAPLMFGATVIITETFTPDIFWQQLVQNTAHTAILDTIRIELMVKAAKQHIAEGTMRFGGKIIQQDTKHFRHIAVFDTALTTQRAHEFEDIFGMPIITGFKHPKTDQLLTLLPITLAWIHHQAWLHGYDTPTIGSALLSMMITDADGNTCPANQHGYLTINQTDGTSVNTGVQGYYLTDDDNQAFYFLS